MKKKLIAASLVALGLFAGQAFAAAAQDQSAAEPHDGGRVQLAQSAEIPAVLSESADLASMTNQALAARQRQLAEVVRNKALSKDVRQSARTKLLETRAELLKRRAERDAKKPANGKKPVDPATAPQAEKPKEPAAAEQPAPAQTPPKKKPGGNANEQTGGADNGAETAARNFLNNASSTQALSDRDLRRRLNEMRNLLAGNKLSANTQKELRVLLRKERDVLRNRVGQVKPKPPQQEQDQGGVTTAPQPKGEPKITDRTPRDVVLQDRRRPDDLRDDELRIRIRVILDFQNSDRYRGYNEAQRREWNEYVNRDREFLRRRLDERRKLRRAQLERSSNINIVIRDDDRYDGPDDVFAAEVQDDDIERVLIAPPRRPVARKVTVQEYEQDPQARRAMSRIEVDTIRFGFNEAFVREEEVDNLDRIAWVIERVLAKYPNETFLIEGHTDAVGDNSYNQKLSRARAEAVKKALSTYYVIPGRNLRTVGMGERYLKIPTAEAEQENRRVSISRATAVISGFAD